MESATQAGAPGPSMPCARPLPNDAGALLVAEDSITARTLVKSILEGAGYEVVATVDGVER